MELGAQQAHLFWCCHLQGTHFAGGSSLGHQARCLAPWQKESQLSCGSLLQP